MSSGLISRVSTADQNFNKDMELTPRVATEFDLTLDSSPALHAIQTMNFFQLKGTAAVLSKFSNLLWRWRSDLAHYESEYGYILFSLIILYAYIVSIHVSKNFIFHIFLHACKIMILIHSYTDFLSPVIGYCFVEMWGNISAYVRCMCDGWNSLCFIDKISLVPGYRGSTERVNLNEI